MSIKLLPDLGDLTEGLGVTGIIGIVLIPILLPVVTGVGRPVAKAAVKRGLLFYEKSKEAIAEVSETWEDIIAEAKAEIGEERMKSAEPREI
ncbi:DUF5132 domain-containing protein [Nostoc sp. FACHB-110]|uniref:DUF5132 domain-containing protein n=1 Tax=Nostoc sp. FACHB-110 TaxID=2692834 RepID=UPI0016856F4E|nr:DUF5132 domain-containing protein [Nostoc sp. FACHB-110]MBD2437715.1 DUF5132 domain-containing protein [Nostoc sp. FACHB-110]